MSLTVKRRVLRPFTVPSVDANGPTTVTYALDDSYPTMERFELPATAAIILPVGQLPEAALPTYLRDVFSRQLRRLADEVDATSLVIEASE